MVSLQCDVDSFVRRLPNGQMEGITICKVDRVCRGWKKDMIVIVRLLQLLIPCNHSGVWYIARGKTGDIKDHDYSTAVTDHPTSCV